jgi:hypothetical protein
VANDWKLQPRRQPAGGGYLRLTDTKGASGRLAFTGRSVALYGPRHFLPRLPAIYLDGVRVATVNQWSATILARQPLYLRNGLSLSRSHVLEVRSLGTAGHTGGTWIAIDAVSILR